MLDRKLFVWNGTNYFPITSPITSILFSGKTFQSSGIGTAPGKIRFLSLIQTKFRTSRPGHFQTLWEYLNALFPIRVDGSRGKEKNFFSREKKFFSSPRTPLHFSKKAAYFVKKGSAPY